MEVFSQPARLRLPHSLRYTRPVFEFLQNLTVPGRNTFGNSLGSPLYLSEGPDVVIAEARPEETAEMVSAIASDWVSKGLCRAHDIMILGYRRDRTLTSLGALDALGDLPLCDYSSSVPDGSVAYLNIHRSKGLDRLAVILIDMPRWEESANQGDEGNLEAYFAGASRARQLLAVVHLESER